MSISAVSATWTPGDDAEHHRLATEMNDDASMQYTLFTFGITASTAVLGFLASAAMGTTQPAASRLEEGLFFLVPLVILLPTSLMILNLARTRNRKAAYVFVYLDPRRLCMDRAIKPDTTTLLEVRKTPSIPWETALLILDRSNTKAKRFGHLSPTLDYMALSSFAIELLCIAFAFYIWFQAGQFLSMLVPALLVLALVIPVYIVRINALRDLSGIRTCWSKSCTRVKNLERNTSIQGYAARWIRWECEQSPKYLREWMHEYETKLTRSKFSIFPWKWESRLGRCR